jgi:hypothetical protein
MVYYSQDPITERPISGKSQYPAIFVSRMTDNQIGYQIIKTKWRPSCFSHDPITGPIIRSYKQNGGHISGSISDICPDAKLDRFIKRRVIKNILFVTKRSRLAVQISNGRL